MRAAREPVEHIRIRVFDREPGWECICAELVELTSIGIKIELEFIQFDVTDPKALDVVDLSDEDLVSMSFFVSEVCCLAEKDSVKTFFEGAFGRLKAGSLVLYNDNRDSAFRDFFDGRLKAAGEFEPVAVEDAAEMRLGGEEESSVLADYKARFKGRSTRLKGSTSYRLVRKK